VLGKNRGTGFEQGEGSLAGAWHLVRLALALDPEPVCDHGDESYVFLDVLVHWEFPSLLRLRPETRAAPDPVPWLHDAVAHSSVCFFIAGHHVGEVPPLAW
jgi:hypothetical protein